MNSDITKIAQEVYLRLRLLIADEKGIPSIFVHPEVDESALLEAMKAEAAKIRYGPKRITLQSGVASLERLFMNTVPRPRYSNDDAEDRAIWEYSRFNDKTQTIRVWEDLEKDDAFWTKVMKLIHDYYLMMFRYTCTFSFARKDGYVEINMKPNQTR